MRQSQRIQCSVQQHSRHRALCVGQVTLWDLTALSLLPQNDPASLLVLGRPQAGPSAAGCALHSLFVGGRRIISCGELLTVGRPEPNHTHER